MLRKIDNDILICIFNYRHDDNARRWLSILSPYFETVVLDSGNDKVCEDFIQYPNIYYTGLWNEMKKLSEAKQYKWVGIICSDVEIDDENAKLLVQKISKMSFSKNLGTWSLLGDLRGHSNKYVYGLWENDYFRVFEGFFQFIRKDVLCEIEYIDTNINLYGYCIDFYTCFISNKLGYANICDDDIMIYHPNEKGYDVCAAKIDSKKFITYIRNKYQDFFKGNILLYNENNEYEHKAIWGGVNVYIPA